MDKPFLLIAGQNCYPCTGTEDWIGRFETKEGAEALVTKNKVGHSYRYTVNGVPLDWYYIVDLDSWEVN